MSALAEPLFFFDGSEVEAARTAAQRGETVVAFSRSAATVSSAASIPVTRAVDTLGDDPEMPLYRAAADWTRAFGLTAQDAGGETLRRALAYRDTTLWWWAELYLHHNTEAVRRVRFLETVARVVEAFPDRPVRTHGLGHDETILVRRLCATRGLAFADEGIRRATPPSPTSALTVGLLEASKVLATALKALGGARTGPVPAGSLLFVSHAAFWKWRPGPNGGMESYEHYFDSLLREATKAGLPVVTLGVGPQSPFRARSAGERWRERLSRRRDEHALHIGRFVTPGLAARSIAAFGRAWRIHKRFRNAVSLERAFSHRGVSFADLSAQDLARTLLLQVPWAARSLLEFEAAFTQLNPRLVCLYAESSGLGRAAIESARGLGIRTLGVQHGILYPNYFSYERTVEDVADGSPVADTTATYGQDGVRLLESAFKYPRGRVVATGSPRYDALTSEVRAIDRGELRSSLGVSPAEKLIVLASRYEGIRETHKAAGAAFTGLLAAVGGIDGARLVVKPHPAEPANAYDQDIANAALRDRVRVVSDRALTDLLPAADLLVTVESLSATEALVAGVPVVVLRHPSNLRDLVASGVALGVPEDADPGPSLRALLTDAAVRERWRKARETFLADVACGVDGQALERQMALLRRMAALD